MLAPGLARLDAWIEREGFQGWDPYDALNSPLLKRLTFGRRQLGQVWVQLLKRCPVNLRPLLGVAAGYNPKGMALFLASYLRKFQATGQVELLDRAQFFARWLEGHPSPGHSGACWGYNFDWPNRGFFAPAGTPTVVNTAFVGLSLLDAQRLFQGLDKDSLAADLAPGLLSTARSACDFFLHDLNQIHPRQDELCFSYTSLDHRFVHNANLLAAWLLAEVSIAAEQSILGDHALAAARYTARRQRPDGSWLYGEGPADGWVDSFHTGFVLVALRRLSACLETAEFDGAVERGYAYWKRSMFLADGTPKYYPHAVHPIDVHSVAQAVLTFLEFVSLDAGARWEANRVAIWGIEHMQDPQGFFHFQIHRHYRIRIPYMRWSQAWMQRALTELSCIGGGD